MGQYAPVPRHFKIDERLLAKAKRVGGFRSDNETINRALAEFIRTRSPHPVAELFGTVDFVPGFDHKKLRSAR